MKTYEITFRPIPTLTYSYVVDAEDNEEAISKAKCLIREPKLAREIALSGQKRTLTDYTTENQVDQLLLHLRKLLN